MHKLTDEQVREIIVLGTTGLKQRVIAEQFGVCRQTVNDILLGNSRRTDRAAKSKAESVVAKLPFDHYVVEEMDRAGLRGSPYNPRIITDVEKKKLKAILKKHGMVTPPTWNKRTGNLVGGHQRISQLDTIHGSPNYTLQVAVIDVDEVAERELNIALNNQQAAGDWDLEKLEDMFRDGKVAVEATGFDIGDLYRLFGDAPGRSHEDIEKLAESLRSMRGNYDAAIEKAKAMDDFYLVVVFGNYEQRKGFLDRLGCPDNRYQSGLLLLELIQERREVQAQGPVIEETPAVSAPS